MQLLAVLMAESLEARTCTVEHLASAWQLDFKAAWRPDDAFFALLRDKTALSAMLAEAATPAVAKANAGGTAKQLRTVLRDTIAGANGRKANPDWRPRWMHCASGRYDEEADCKITSDAARVIGFARAS